MKLNLVYLDDSLGEAFRQKFKRTPLVEFLQEDITRISADAIVSPANSFGFMDGGLDYALSERFGWDLQNRLQSEIRQRPLGELLIGEALIIETGDQRVPYLISAPTMRVPMSFNISTSVNAYLAMKAILIAAVEHRGIESVAVPGLCTGVGKMKPEIAAYQMYSAYQEIVLGQNVYHEDFGEAQRHHLKLNKEGMIYD